MEAFETLIERIAPNLYAYRDRFFTSFAATFEMFGKAGLIAFVVGLFFGVLLVVSGEDGIRPMPVLNRTLGVVINLLRSAPFLILLVALTPVTRAIVGTSLGSTATIVPLVIGSAPFIARMVESSIKEVDSGVIEAAQSMGASPMQIVLRVMLPEAKPSLTVGAAIAVTTILGCNGRFRGRRRPRHDCSQLWRLPLSDGRNACDPCSARCDCAGVSGGRYAYCGSD